MRVHISETRVNRYLSELEKNNPTIDKKAPEVVGRARRLVQSQVTYETASRLIHEKGVLERRQDHIARQQEKRGVSDSKVDWIGKARQNKERIKEIKQALTALGVSVPPPEKGLLTPATRI